MSRVNSPASLFLERSRYFLGTEYLTKLQGAVAAIPADKIWWRPDELSNSVGNLLLHLNGNVRQWIVCGVGGGKAPRSGRRVRRAAVRRPPFSWPTWSARSAKWTRARR